MGRKSKKQGETRKYIVGSLCCAAETSTHCKANYTPIKINNKKTTPVVLHPTQKHSRSIISTEASERFLNRASLDQKMQDQGSTWSICRGLPKHLAPHGPEAVGPGPGGKAFFIAELLGESIQIVFFFFFFNALDSYCQIIS